MELTIVRGRIRISFSEDISKEKLDEIQERLRSCIGSAKVVANHPEFISCALSVQNFRKLKALGCKVADDLHTREVIRNFRTKLNLYEEESNRATRVKAGEQIYRGYQFKLPPFEHQKLGFQFLHSMKTPALLGDCGTGKGLPLSTKVLTPYGWIEIGSISLGDMVIARDGQAYPVKGIYDQGKQDIYNIIFSDGSNAVCDGAHLWAVKSFNDVARNKPWRTMSTVDLLNSNLKYGSRRQSRRWRIPMVCPPEFSTKLAIPPYILGVLLGDGDITSTTPRWTKEDLEIVDRVSSLLPPAMDIEVSTLSCKTRTKSWSIRKKDRSNKPNPITQELQRLKLFGCKSESKFIPHDYLYASSVDRIELLRGLLDTDGSNGSTIEFSSASKRLAEGVVFLVQSLGGTATMASKDTRYSYRGETRTGLTSWRVHLSMPSTIQPFHLERKKNKKKQLEPKRCIDSIEPCGRKETRCIRVGSPDNTFVIEQFVVTHNTFICLTFADSLIKAGEDWAFIVICPVNLIKHVWIEDAAKFSDLTVTSLREPTVVSVRAEDYDDKKDGDLSKKDRSALRASRRADPDWKKRAKRHAQARHRKILEKRFAQDSDMFVINPENLRTDSKEKRILSLCKRLLSEGKELCLIIDESSLMKSRTSRTAKAVKRIRSFCSRCIIMTGTPSPNGLLDLWSQFDILDGGMTLQPSFIDYRNDNCVEKVLRGVTWEKNGKTFNATKWMPVAGAPMRVYKTIEPRMIRFKLNECIDLPPIRFFVRPVMMTSEQQDLYQTMKERLFVEMDDESVTSKVIVSKLIKLREITGGFVRTDEGNDKPINKDAPKMLELDRLLEQSIDSKLGDDGPPLKAIVWAQYQWECKTLIDRYKKKYGARGLFGGISNKEKEVSLHRFKKMDSCRLLVCHPQSAGHGLTLTEANYAFYYSLSHNFEEFYQSFRRITRPGQKRSMTYYFLLSPGTIDEELLQAIREKKNLSDVVTDGRVEKDFLPTDKRHFTGQIELNLDLPSATL